MFPVRIGAGQRTIWGQFGGQDRIPVGLQGVRSLGSMPPCMFRDGVLPGDLGRLLRREASLRLIAGASADIRQARSGRTSRSVLVSGRLSCGLPSHRPLLPKRVSSSCGWQVGRDGVVSHVSVTVNAEGRDCLIPQLFSWLVPCCLGRQGRRVG